MRSHWPCMAKFRIVERETHRHVDAYLKVLAELTFYRAVYDIILWECVALVSSQF